MLLHGLAQRTHLALERFDLFLLELDGGGGHAGVAVQVDAFAVRRHGWATGLIVDDEAEVRSRRRWLALVMPAREAHLQQAVANRFELGLIEIVDASLVTRE